MVERRGICFLAKQRTSGYIEDAFSAFGKLEVRTHTVWSFLGDPRDIGFDGVYYASVQGKYKYALRDFGEKILCDEIFRSVNANPYNETLMRRDIDMWKVCKYHEAVFDRKKCLPSRLLSDTERLLIFTIACGGICSTVLCILRKMYVTLL